MRLNWSFISCIAFGFFHNKDTYTIVFDLKDCFLPSPGLTEFVKDMQLVFHQLISKIQLMTLLENLASGYDRMFYIIAKISGSGSTESYLSVSTSLFYSLRVMTCLST